MCKIKACLWLHSQSRGRNEFESWLGAGRPLVLGKLAKNIQKTWNAAWCRLSSSSAACLASCWRRWSNSSLLILTSICIISMNSLCCSRPRCALVSSKSISVSGNSAASVFLFPKKKQTHNNKYTSPATQGSWWGCVIESHWWSQHNYMVHVAILWLYINVSCTSLGD